MSAYAAAFPQSVKIDSGEVSGVAETTGVASFKGIPFAAPPVGDLRLKPPVAPAKWTGVLKADHFSASCVQPIREGGQPSPNAEFSVHKPVSEDCLYLNVWTPAKGAAEKLPVMVWFYGGGFFEGSASVPAYDAEGLASKGVVVVTINYRLGLLGFLATPDLDAESPHHVSGNYGTLDQIEALKWVSRNIAAFGGDAKRVTIFGQSAGGGSVQFLSVSPLARGLFARGIAESSTMFAQDPEFLGSPMAYKKLSDAEKDNQAYLAKAGVESLTKLRAMTTEEVMGLPRAPFPPAFFSPVVDGYVLPQTFAETYAQHKQADVPIMVGGASDEGGAVPHRVTTVAAYQKWAQQKYGSMTEEFLKLYPAATDEDAGTMQNLASRDQSRISKTLWAEAFGKGNHSKIFLYFWNHPLPGPAADRLGAFHMSEIPYVMKSLSKADRPYTDDDWKIADMMSQYWSNFAATGDPNGKGLPAWPAFSAGGKTMQLGNGNEPISPASSEARLDFFKRFYATQPAK